MATEPVVDSGLAAGAEGRKAALAASALLPRPEGYKEAVPASSTADLEPLESNAVSAATLAAAGLGPKAATATVEAVSAADLEPRAVSAAAVAVAAASLEPRAVAVAGIWDGPKAASI